MQPLPPLAGLRVLELAGGVAGPYAGRLLALLGAEVWKVEPDAGDPARVYPVDDRPLTGTSPLYLHLNAGKHSLRRSRADLARLLDWAQVVLDDRVRRELERVTPDPRAARLLVSVTPWGFESPENGGIADELLVQAASGAMLADPESRTPRRFPGWQAQVHAGAYAAAGALAALGSGARHVDVAWVSALLAGVEGTLTPVLHERGRASRPGAQAGVQANAFPAGVF
ncbi:MAG: CoA transferase, partial [bacterium]